MGLLRVEIHPLSQDDTSDKNHKATEQKLSTALNNGDGIGLSYLLSAVNGTAFIFLLITLAPNYALYIYNAIKIEFASSFTRDFSAKHLSSLVVPSLYFSATLSFTIILITLQIKITSKNSVFRLKNLRPSLNKVSPISNLSKKYNYNSIRNGTITVVKITTLTIFTLISMMVFLHHPEGKNAHTIAFHLNSLKSLVIHLQAITLLFLLADLYDSILAFFKRNMMSNEEIKQELKDNQVNPEIKGKLREKANEVAFTSLPEAVSKATIIMVNPTHYAVALEWRQDSLEAPRCTAKGQDELALTIIDLAKRNKIPIYRDPATARDIYKKVEVGEVIKIEHYSAVAACLKIFQRANN